jgi:hypothetical protein
MLKDDFSVEEIVEFWNSEDQDQVEGVLGSLTLTESVDYSNPDLALVCERLGMGAAWGWISRNAGRLKNLFKRGGPKPKVKPGDTPGTVKVTGSRPQGKGKPKVTGDVVPAKPGPVKNIVKKNPLATAAAATALTAGGILVGQDAIDNMKDNEGKKPPTGPGAQPGDVYSTVTKTTPVAGPKGRAWWQTYEKAAPYSSSKRHHDNIRN